MKCGYALNGTMTSFGPEVGLSTDAPNSEAKAVIYEEDA
jgi:hypothetical protein